MSLSKVLTDSHSTSALFVTAAASAALLGGLAAYISSYPGGGKSEKQDEGEEVPSLSPS